MPIRKCQTAKAYSRSYESRVRQELEWGDNFTTISEEEEFEQECLRRGITRDHEVEDDWLTE